MASEIAMVGPTHAGRGGDLEQSESVTCHGVLPSK